MEKFHHLVAKTLERVKHMLEVHLASTVWFPAARHLGNLKRKHVSNVQFSSPTRDYLHMSNDWQEVFDVPGDVAFDLLQVEHI